VYGVTRTVVITGQTVRAFPIVFPVGLCAFNIIHWTQLLAQSASYASLFVHPEVFVRNQVLVVIAAYHVSIGIGNGTFHQFLHVPLLLCHHFADVCHTLFGGLNLLMLPFGRVQM
jgi:hypothetical protein